MKIDLEKHKVLYGGIAAGILIILFALFILSISSEEIVSEDDVELTINARLSKDLYSKTHIIGSNRQKAKLSIYNSENVLCVFHFDESNHLHSGSFTKGLQTIDISSAMFVPASPGSDGHILLVCRFTDEYGTKPKNFRAKIAGWKYKE